MSIFSVLDRSRRLINGFLIFLKILKALIALFQMRRLRASIYNLFKF